MLLIQFQQIIFQLVVDHIACTVPSNRHLFPKPLCKHKSSGTPVWDFWNIHCCSRVTGRVRAWSRCFLNVQLVFIDSNNFFECRVWFCGSPLWWMSAPQRRQLHIAFFSHALLWYFWHYSIVTKPVESGPLTWNRRKGHGQGHSPRPPLHCTFHDFPARANSTQFLLDVDWSSTHVV